MVLWEARGADFSEVHEPAVCKAEVGKLRDKKADEDEIECSKEVECAFRWEFGETKGTVIANVDFVVTVVVVNVIMSWVSRICVLRSSRLEIEFLEVKIVPKVWVLLQNVNSSLGSEFLLEAFFRFNPAHDHEDLVKIGVMLSVEVEAKRKWSKQ
jgi:hypothetical protein